MDSRTQCVYELISTRIGRRPTVTYSLRLSKEKDYLTTGSNRYPLRLGYWLTGPLSTSVRSVWLSVSEWVGRHINDFDCSITNSFSILNRRMSSVARSNRFTSDIVHQADWLALECRRLQCLRSIFINPKASSKKSQYRTDFVAY